MSLAFINLIVLQYRLFLKRHSRFEPALGYPGPPELGTPLTGQNFSLYPVYVRGEAYLAAHQGPPAVGEFQKILDHPGVVVNEPIGALARLQIGRAYVLSGDTAKAKAAYTGLPGPLERCRP